jgi:D-alanyl-D-alanine carboxypeptidase
MKMVLPFLLLATLAAPLAAQAPDQPAGATPGQRRSDQERAYDARRKGAVMSPRAIEGRVLPSMKGYEYLGFDLDFATSVYTLKFMRDGVVVWVDVDGRSGQIIGRTGK